MSDLESVYCSSDLCCMFSMSVIGIESELRELYLAVPYLHHISLQADMCVAKSPHFRSNASNNNNTASNNNNTAYDSSPTSQLSDTS